MEETNCQLCATQEIFEGLVAIGYETDEAFHLAVGHLLSNTIENVVETTYDKAHQVGFEEGYLTGEEKGFDEGYNQATLDVAEVVVAYARSANDN